MKTKKFLVLLFMLLISTQQLISQQITIEQTFQNDTTFDPFTSSTAMYGLNISGSVKFLSDTSLVRLIFSDTNGEEYMVFESYPMIASDTMFDITKVCDETCYLNGLTPD